MNQEMSIIGLMLNASFVVQLVMLMLIAASVLSWVIIFQRGRLLSATRQQMQAFEDRFWSGIDLNDLYRECQQQVDKSSAEVVFVAGLKEFGKLRQQKSIEPEAAMAGVQRAMRVLTLARPWNECMIPQTVPNRPIYGLVEPMVASIGRF